MLKTAPDNWIPPVMEGLESRTMASASPALQGQGPVRTYTSLTVDAGAIGQPITFNVTVLAVNTPSGPLELYFHGKLFQELSLPAAAVAASPNLDTRKPVYLETSGTYTIPAGTDAADLFGVGSHLVRAQFVGTEDFFYSSSAVAEFRVTRPQFVSQPSGVGTETLAAGSGPALQPGDTATVQYNAYLAASYRMSSTTETQTPDTETFTVDASPEQVIPGLDAGVIGMQAGETRAISIPYELGYGKQGIKHLVPPRANLVFLVTLVSIG